MHSMHAPPAKHAPAAATCVLSQSICTPAEPIDGVLHIGVPQGFTSPSDIQRRMRVAMQGVRLWRTVCRIPASRSGSAPLACVTLRLPACAHPPPPNLLASSRAPCLLMRRSHP